MPKDHEKFPYVESLIKKKDIQWLKNELKCVKDVINNCYKYLLFENLSERNKKEIIKNIKHEEKLLNYINKALEELLFSK